MSRAPSSRDLPPPPVQCPRCGSTNTVPIVYGYPVPSFYAENRERIEFGGCVRPIDPPTHNCRACNRSWAE